MTMRAINRVLTTLATVGTLFAVGGCLQYNGAFGGGANDDLKFVEFKKELKKQRQATQAKQGDGAPAQFVDGKGEMEHVSEQYVWANTPEAQRAAVAQHENEIIQTAARDAGVPIRGLGLYGDLPNQQPAIASPQDSPHNAVQVTFATEGADFDPAINKEGTMLAYASTQHRNTSDIYIKNVTGTTRTKITEDPANDVMPAWSNDGKWIAFASDRGGSWDIWLVSADGSGMPRQITSDPTQEIHPSFSPDDRYLVYSAYGAQSGQWELVVVEIDNPSRKQFIAHGLFPKWSPTDNRIVFQRARERGSRWFSLWTIELEGGQAKRPTEIASSSNAAVITPDWSPDGKFLVFCTVINPPADEKESVPPQADVWVIGADGRDRTNLTQSRFVNLQPTWASDGTIYFVSNRGRNGQENIWAIKPDETHRMVVGSPEETDRPLNTATVQQPTE